MALMIMEFTKVSDFRINRLTGKIYGSIDVADEKGNLIGDYMIVPSEEDISYTINGQCNPMKKLF